ncbi:hypothetical protein GLT81_00670 [Nanohaloarchaea archaeon]|jgi:hypothetical protein|nr:hypothetical protein [Candidatus Nanohaloarchaea archaeon]
MSDSESEKTIVDEEDSNVFVVDPEDYQKTQKIKSINRARMNVLEHRKKTPNTAGSNEWKGINARLAETVADYGNELLPLIEDALEEDILDEDDLESELCNIVEFIMLNGRTRDESGELEEPNPSYSMSVYRQLGRIERKLGLGLELETESEPAII